VIRRTCGPCTVCCTLQGVKEGLSIPKPAGVQCPHVCKTGCSIYEKRPTECQEFACLWLQGLGEVWDRPDLLGVMFEVQDRVEVPFILARTLARGREKGSRVRDLVKQLRFLTGLPVGARHPDQETGEWYVKADVEILE